MKNFRFDGPTDQFGPRSVEKVHFLGEDTSPICNLPRHGDLDPTSRVACAKIEFILVLSGQVLRYASLRTRGLGRTSFLANKNYMLTRLHVGFR